MRRPFAVSVLALALAAGCIDPTIPIPPPLEPAEMMFDITMQNGISIATFTYPIDSNYCGGVTYLYDRNLGSGVIHNVNPNCSMGPIALEANLGDAVVVSVQVGGQTTQNCVVLRQGPQATTCQ